MAGTLDSALERKKDQDVERAAKEEQRRRDVEDEGVSHKTVAEDGKQSPGAPSPEKP